MYVQIIYTIPGVTTRASFEVPYIEKGLLY